MSLPRYTKAKTLSWTRHARGKMRQWGLSESRVRRVIHAPSRIEEGVAEDTIALMQSTGSQKNPTEIWTMIREMKATRRIISAWRYPGRTKPGDPLPPEIVRELRGGI